MLRIVPVHREAMPVPLLDRLPFRARLPATTLLWCGLIAAATGACIMVFGRPGAVPPASSLVEVTGTIERVSVHDLSGAPTNGDHFPGLTEVHIRLEGRPEVFVYPSGYPIYFVVRDHARGPTTLLVNQADFDDERTIWGLRARGLNDAPIVVAYDDVAATLARIDRSAAHLGGRFALVGLVLLVAARILAAINARLPTPTEETRERWVERREQVTGRLLSVAAAMEAAFSRGVRAVTLVLGPTIGPAVWGLFWCLVYAGGALGLGIAIYGG